MKRPQPTLLCHYHYDALDRLIAHTPLVEPQLQRFYCKSRVTTEIQGAIYHSIIQHDDQLLAQLHVEDDVISATLLAMDQQRSVLQTLNDDIPAQPIAYSPYGHRPPENGLLSLLGFNGERPDLVTGHYLLGSGYRAFNPVLMRFNSPDNWSPFGKGGVNSYTYCSGDPINSSDPSGHTGLVKLYGSSPMRRITATPTVIPREFRVRPGITAPQAQNAMKYLYNLESTYKSYETGIGNAHYFKSLRIEEKKILNAHTTQPGFTLQEIAENSIKSKSHSAETIKALNYPTLLKNRLNNTQISDHHALLKAIKNDRPGQHVGFSESKLHDIAFGEAAADPNLRTAAQNFSKELYDIRRKSPIVRRLQNKFQRTFDEFFSQA